MSVFFLPVFVHDILLMPLNSSTFCVWSRIGNTARHSTPSSRDAGGTSGSSQRCWRSRGSWQRTSRRGSNHGKLTDKHTQQGHDGEMTLFLRIAQHWQSWAKRQRNIRCLACTRKMCACVRTGRSGVYKIRCIFSCLCVFFPNALFGRLAQFSQLVSLLPQCFFFPQWAFWFHRLLHWSFHFCCFATSALLLLSLFFLLLLLRLHLHRDCVLLRRLRPHQDCVLLRLQQKVFLQLAPTLQLRRLHPHSNGVLLRLQQRHLHPLAPTLSKAQSFSVSFFHRLDSFCSLLLGFPSFRCVFLWDFFLRCCNHKLCHNTSVVASHVDHVICFSISAATHVFPVHQYVVQLFLYTFQCPVWSLLFKRFLYIVLSAAQCIISHCFIQSPLLFSSLSVCDPTLTRSTPNQGQNLALKSPPTICMLFFLDFVSFSIDLCALAMWWSAYSEWRKYTLINSTRCLLTVIDVATARPLI